MLLYAAHRMTKARRFASRWIVRILEVLPRMLWNHKAAFLMMDILRFLDNRKAGYTDDGFRNPLLAKLFFLDEKEAALASADFMLVAEAWLKSALKQSSGETIGLAQTYLVEISNKSPYTMLNDQSDLMVLLGRFVVHADVASTIIRSPSKHSKFLGEIKGMIFALEATSPDMDRETVLRTISANLKADVRRTYRTIDEPNFAQRVNQSVFRAAALIITNEKVETELLQLICYVPSMKFDTTVMEIAVTAWTWLMTCRPELVKRMLAYLIQAWELTASTGKGLYGVESGSPNPFLEKMTYGAPKPHTGGQNNSEIHIAWIRFFINRFRADRLCGSDHLKLYTQLFLVATQSENALKSNWSAREARFDLALLGLRIAVDLDAGGHKEAPFVWTQVFDVALGWFEHPPMFGRIKKDELKKLVLFYQLIKDVKLEKAAVWSTSRINRIFLNMACDTDRIELSDAQQLLMVLLEHEMNRLATWLSPLEDASGEFAAMPPLPNERLIKWQSFVRIAWYLNPIVAIQLASRFVTSAETIESEIVEVAKYNEIAGLECPDAVSLFLKHSWRHRSDDQLRVRHFSV
ncbi:hypothetical protein BC831DRAFT_15797 [Entophlyctis helioformis]|nr:hypothetical protein BC831DRAFT_15797 [Entophlyctis helioformis]